MLTLKEVVKALFEEYDSDSFGVVCTVKSVDITKYTCVCTRLEQDGDITAVRLKADASGNGLIIVPAVNSLVIVQPLSETTGYISMFSKIQSIQLLDGSRGGLVDVANLVSRLNNLENKFNAHTHTGVTTGAGISGTPSPTSLISPVTQRSDIENTNIIHGNP